MRGTVGRRSTSIVIAVAVSIALGLIRPAWAVVVDASPTWPIPSDAPDGPPPIPAMPAAGDEAPPSGLIVDPVTPSASCGGWERQSNYGGRWPTGSAWWEYTCTHDGSVYVNTCPGPACDAFCPSCYWQSWHRDDRFVWDGSDALFYGEVYSESVIFDSGEEYHATWWWDAPTSTWYRVAHADEPDPEPDPGPAANVPPEARFTFACDGSTCDFDASTSADGDGSIVAHAWTFGDGSAAGGMLIQHRYQEPGAFTVALSVTDDTGATTTASATVTVVALEARASKVRGVHTVELTWRGPAPGAPVDVYRDGSRIATVTTTWYVDTVGRHQDTYVYVACVVAVPSCSNQATVRF
ncbi:MAG: PKD domain-containing protein [Actinobacteria bacterium]|nr:PKD domain-containing protein [Actinomycetota bacterium]